MRIGFSMQALLLFAVAVNAEEVKEIDYCKDAKVIQEWRQHLSDFPNDPIILKLAGLREGLCLMIDRKQISHELATEIWEEERQRGIVDRSKEESRKLPKFIL